MRKNQLEAIALTRMTEGKRARKTFMDCGYQPLVKINGTATKF